MLKSMTGYGRGEGVLGDTVYTVEMKSVNHRYFEFNCRAPKSLSFLEDRLKAFLATGISRGKVDLYIDVRAANGGQGSIILNTGLAESYIAALKKLKNSFGLRGRVSLDLVAKNNDLFVHESQKLDENAVWEAVQAATAAALQAFLKMRENEGERLCLDVESRCNDILDFVSKIEKRSPETIQEYRERLRQKMTELLGDRQIEEQRLLTETAIFADKIAVDEETVRLRSHIAQLKQLLSASEPVGRKLDFVVQEMNREANTIGSKCVDLEISHIVIEIKAQIEKIREQIQNIE